VTGLPATTAPGGGGTGIREQEVPPPAALRHTPWVPAEKIDHLLDGAGEIMQDQPHGTRFGPGASGGRHPAPTGARSVADGLVTLEAGCPARAAAALRRARYADARFDPAAFTLGRAYDALGDNAAARRACAQALRTLDPAGDRHVRMLQQGRYRRYRTRVPRAATPPAVMTASAPAARRPLLITYCDCYMTNCGSTLERHGRSSSSRGTHGS
jgi:hypothetical protein